MGFFFDQRRESKKILAEPFPEAWLPYLHDNVFLYRLLSEAEQARLRDCLRIFIAEKYWEGCAGLEITDEIRVTVAAQACLLVLGFEDYYFDELKTILVYPGGYLGLDPDPLGVRDGLQHRLGEAHHKGPVVLSWWQACWDGRRLGHSNLVLHEFAHKLAELGDPEMGMPAIEDPKLAERWQAVMGAAFERLVDDVRHRRATLLDDYGETNQAEFFAVLTECFFLRPADLRRENAPLYELLAQWYRQDPAQRQVSDAIPAEADDADKEYARHVIAECSAAIRRFPDYADAYRARADWYRRLGEFQNAVADCTAVIRLTADQEQATAYCERGSLHLSAGHQEQAITDASAAILRNPYLAEAYRLRGRAYLAHGEAEKAQSDHERAQQLARHGGRSGPNWQ